MILTTTNSAEGRAIIGDRGIDIDCEVVGDNKLMVSASGMTGRRRLSGAEACRSRDRRLSRCRTGAQGRRGAGRTGPSRAAP